MAIAIVLAGGSGSRMNSDVAKQFMKLKGKEVLYYSLKVFQENKNISEIVLVTRSEDIEFCKTNIVDRYGFDKVSDVCAGGKERYDSVYMGLNRLDSNSNEIVIIHDGARPFITDRMIDESINAAEEYGACAVGMPVKDTIKIVNEDCFGIETPNRSTLYQIQTPQTFRLSLIMSAYGKMLVDKNHKITDDTMVVEQYEGVYSKIIQGAYENIKITTPEDLEIADKLVEKIFEKICKIS